MTLFDLADECSNYRALGRELGKLYSLSLSNVPLFRNKRFALNEMFHRNASKFAIFYV